MTNQQDFIREARRLLQPHKVRLGHVPRWFGQAAVDRLRDAFVLDHWGSVRVDDVTYFVTEPYGIGRKGFDAIDDLANENGWTWLYDVNSYHFPGRTLRIVFSENPNYEAR